MPLVLFLLCATLMPVHSFNLSPQPNMILSPSPSSGHVGPNASLFGYSVCMRSTSIFVGAPYFSTAEDPHRGSVTRCRFENFVPDCQLFDLKPGVARPTMDGSPMQALGSIMAGLVGDTELFVVCSMRNTSYEQEESQAYERNPGACYRSRNTVSDDVKHWWVKLNNIMYADKVLLPSNSAPPAQSGVFGDMHEMSVHVSDDNREMLIGVPGASTRIGTVVRYRKTSDSGYNKQRPVPATWSLPINSNIGFAVSSGQFGGPGNEAISYLTSGMIDGVATVLLFDFVFAMDGGMAGVKVLQRLASGRKGEHFGYALAADDFNGDDWTELIVGAPAYEIGDKSRSRVKDGAVYVFGNLKGKFQPPTRLSSPCSGRSGRFGETLARLGDLNQDGYNDLAVGAPLEEAGAVYIFLGSVAGISSKPSQKLSAPAEASKAGSVPQPRFGHAISKGADIDQNGYPDVVVGAPNADTAYVYRSYPYVNIKAQIVPAVSMLDLNDTQLKVTVRWSIVTSKELAFEINLAFVVQFDLEVGRMTTEDPLNFTESALQTEKQREFQTNVKFVFEDLTRPIVMTLNYSLAPPNQIPQEVGTFCTTCVAVLPTGNSSRAIVKFRTKCKRSPCSTDLRLTGNVAEPNPFIIGKSNKLVLDFTIENFGEPAYKPQFNMTIPKRVSFVKFTMGDIPFDVCTEFGPDDNATASTGTTASNPSPASETENIFYCILREGVTPLRKGEPAEIRLFLDTSQLRASSGPQAFVAHTWSLSNEPPNEANTAKVLLEDFPDYSMIEVLGRSSMLLTGLSDELTGTVNVTHTLEVRNNGPLDVDRAILVVSVPQNFTPKESRQRFELVRLRSVECWFENKQIESNNDGLRQKWLAALDGRNGFGYRTVDSAERRKHKQYRTLIADPVQSGGVPASRTIVFNCEDTRAECVHVPFMVRTLMASGSGSAIRVYVNMTLDLTLINSMFNDKINLLVVQTTAQLYPGGSERGQTMFTMPIYPATAVIKRTVTTVPMWVYIVAALGGILLLLSIVSLVVYLKLCRRQGNTLNRHRGASETCS